MGCTGLLIFSEDYAPGQRVRIDGNTAELLEVDGFLQGVVVPGGRHRVELIYDPQTLWIGLALFTSSLVALALFWRRIA